MLKTLLLRFLVAELSKYGRDAAGNYVISPQSLDEATDRLADLLQRNIQRPVVTFTVTDVFKIAQRAGFKVVPTRRGGVAGTMLMDKTGAVEHLDVVQRLMDFTVQMVLERISEKTTVREG